MAMGAILQQEQEGLPRVIGYASRIFNTCEKKYCITRKELAAIIFGLRQYRKYLLGRQFIVCSDHAALTYLRSAKELIGQQARWLDFMEELNFTLQHRAGIMHSNADALSRKHSLTELQNIAPCSQCRKRGLIREDHGESVKACQDGQRSSGFVHAITTRAQKRRLPDPVPSPPDLGDDSDADSDIDAGPGESPRCFPNNVDVTVNATLMSNSLLILGLLPS